MAKLIGTKNDDTINGSTVADIIFGMEGKDLIFGGGGNDLIYGDSKSDYHYGDSSDSLYGGAGNDRIYGGYGSDSLIGDKGNDKLYGGDGDDFFIGGEGRDTLIGGNGKDTFDFNKLVESSPYSTIDTIQDFAKGDIIDISGIDANIYAFDGDQRFTFVGASDFYAPGQIRVTSSGYVLGNTDDNFNTVELMIAVQGVPQLSASDFYL